MIDILPCQKVEWLYIWYDLTETLDIPVLVVGAGVAGLATSLFLAAHGVRSLLVERHAGTSIYPRARGVNGRTMELARELGLADEIRRAGERLAPAIGFHAGRSLVEVLDRTGDGGWFLRRVRARGVRGHESKASPTGPCRCTQDELEPILLRGARARGVDARFETELVASAQDETGVTATIRARGTTEAITVRAAYLVAADGARSPIRTRLGIAQTGSRTFGHQLNVYVRAELTALVRGRELSMCLVENERVRGLIASIDNATRWVIHISYDPERGERPEDFPPERCVELVRAAVGVADLPVEILGISPWQSAVRIAERFREGRVFLVGDAAHAIPPWGGFGANSAIQDAHNLAWKLALVLAGTAGASLLATYEAERAPLAHELGAVAGGLNGERGLMTVPAGLGALRVFWMMRRVLPYLSVGYGYDSPAIAACGEPAAGPRTKALDGRPGTRVPHVWIEHAGARRSTLDLVGRGFVLFAGPDAGPWCEAAAHLPVPVACERIAAHAALGIRRDGALLVRPDGFVAWRAKRGGDAAALARAMQQILGRALPRVTSSDGTVISYRSLGRGPALVLLHGGLQAAHSFDKLAEALAETFTVIVPTRRGRAGDDPLGAPEGLAAEVSDLDAVLRATGARRVFGLSSGAVIALAAALTSGGIDQLALYEPPLRIDGLRPDAWAPRLERELARGEVAAAMVTRRVLAPPRARGDRSGAAAHADPGDALRLRDHPLDTGARRPDRLARLRAAAARRHAERARAAPRARRDRAPVAERHARALSRPRPHRRRR
jgi:putative polyketide hydroxylase